MPWSVPRLITWQFDLWWVLLYECMYSCILQAILNAAVRLIGDIVKFAYISSFIWDFLQWLPIRKCIPFKDCSLTSHTKQSWAPHYLRTCYAPAFSLPSRSSHQSLARGHLVVLRISMAQSRSFCTAQYLFIPSFDQFWERFKTSFWHWSHRLRGRVSFKVVLYKYSIAITNDD